MKEIILALLFGSALCSLEPAGYRTASSQYLPPNRSRVSTPSNRYIPASTSSFSSLSSSAPEVLDVRRRNFPSTSYGVSDFKASPASRQLELQSHDEAAKYDFGYRVHDGQGNDYSHQETRDGRLTRGSYSVLLPDGRRQIVEYEADEWGFKPRISYEDAPTAARFDRPAAAYPGAPY